MKRILMVEDNENNRLVMEDMLRRHRKQFQLHTLDDPRQLMPELEANRPDLILMDMRLPHINGWEMAEILKQDERYQDIPIIAVTAHAMKGDDDRALEAGCDDYLSKPIVKQNLLDKLNHWLKLEQN